jgi:hypothetical protein
MSTDWVDYAIAVVACIVFPVLIPVALGIVAFMAINAGINSGKEEE